MVIVYPSQLGFEFQGELSMNSNFCVMNQVTIRINETRIPVVKSKHSAMLNNCNELLLKLKEKSGLIKSLEVYVRAYNYGVVFRYKLFRAEKIGNCKITKEITSYTIPNDPKAWIVEYGGYSTSYEGDHQSGIQVPS